MVAMADRLFTDFDNVSVRDGLPAIADARTVLRTSAAAREPDSVEVLARDWLTA
jgi:hypothetical protein